MPRDYGKIRHRFWTGTTGKELRSLGNGCQVVAAYLISCGSSNMIGLYYLPTALLAHETGMTLEGASKALQRVCETGFAFYDESTEVVFVPRMAREQIGESLALGDRQRAGVVSLLKEYEKSRFVADFLNIYREPYHLEDYSPTSPFEAPSKPLRSQENREQRSGEQENREQDPPVVPQGGQGELPGVPCQADQIRAVIAHYRVHHPQALRNPRSGSKEWRLVRDRLAEGATVHELCKAIDGYHKSRWHQGENDRGAKFLDLSLLLRDAGHVQRGIELDNAGGDKPQRQSQTPRQPTYNQLG